MTGTCERCGGVVDPGRPCPKCALADAGQWADIEFDGQFAGLQILQNLGAGGMGTVYKAQDPQLGRFVALKILSKELSSDPAFVERFKREAQALARLNHPGIVQVYGFGEQDGHWYLTMEYVDGANLRQILQRGKLSPEQALQIVPQVCEALEYAHRNGVVHRDIKPENILLTREGRVKLADFGIAKLARDSVARTATGWVLGTPHYMAPEQVENPRGVDHRQ